MKNRISIFILVLGVVVLFSSCLYIPITYKTFLDTNISADQNTTVTIDNHIRLKRWNDTLVLYAFGTLILPAGNNIFLFDAEFTFSNQYSSHTYKMENIELQYFFEQGKKYKVNGRYKSLGLLKGDEFFVGIYDNTGRSSVLLKEWKIGES